MPNATPIDSEALERLRQYAMADATCPCCDSNAICEDGCTFMDDCPDEHKRMEAARFALYGDAEPDDEQHERTEAKSEWDTEKYLDDRERSRDINSQRG